jgi:hypothetical protein
LTFETGREIESDEPARHAGTARWSSRMPRPADWGRGNLTPRAATSTRIGVRHVVVAAMPRAPCGSSVARGNRAINPIRWKRKDGDFAASVRLGPDALRVACCNCVLVATASSELLAIGCSLRCPTPDIAATDWAAPLHLLRVSVIGPAKCWRAPRRHGVGWLMTLERTVPQVYKTPVLFGGSAFLL